jgi:glycerate dehydrogenase
MTTTAYRHYSRSFSHSSSNNQPRPKAVFLNAARLDYDGQLDWSRLRKMCDLTLHPADAVSDVPTLLALVHEAEIVLTKEMLLPAAVLAQFPPTVRLLCEAGTGFNNLPVTAARARGIPVCNIPTYSTEAVAHMAITYLMNFSVSLLEQQRMIQAGDRSNFTGPFTLPLHEIHGRTIVLVGGAGRIGTKVAEIALALGMHVIITSRQGSLPAQHPLSGHVWVTCTDNVEAVLGEGDYVSLHTPLNDDTRGSFGRAQISLMKNTAFLINTSRGAVCNEDELIACLEEGLIQGAGLDVTTTEPPAADSKLWDLPNVWLSPHTGWRRLETRQRLVDMTCDNIASYCKADTEADILNVVN